MSAKWQMSRMEFQNGSAFQNGSSEWKCIPEWKFRVEVNSRVEYLRGTKWPLWASVDTVHVLCPRPDVVNRSIWYGIQI